LVKALTHDFEIETASINEMHNHSDSITPTTVNPLLRGHIWDK